MPERNSNRAHILEILGSPREANKLVPHLKRSCYFFDRSLGSIAGDAPKDFIKVFEPERSECLKTKKKTWVPYIAKVGMKYYPNESITEQLISDIGRWCGFDMAHLKLYVVQGQVRFCSEYFLSKGERLVHGAEIYSRYLNSSDFVEQVEAEKKEPEFFDYEFARSALLAMFPRQYPKIEKKLVLMLLFDALVGNNDRHMYNWGVVIDVVTNECLRFAPIYDSARGLFWNTRADGLDKYWHVKTGQLSLDHLFKYANAAKPRIGKSITEPCNHFELIEFIHCSKERDLSETLEQHLKSLDISVILRKIEEHYATLLGERRLKTILTLLQHRHERLSGILL